MTKASAVLLAVAAGSPAPAAPVLAPAWSDHAVIQRGQPIVVEGSARPGESVRGTLGAASATAVAGEDGSFSLTFPPRPASSQGVVLTVSASGGGSVRLDDLLVGEVWLCSGQSNMALPLAASDGGDAAARASSDPQLRLLAVPQAAAANAQKAFGSPAEWTPAAPPVARRFSAACYHMARQLRRDLGVPVGAIASSWAGSQIRPWLGRAPAVPPPPPKPPSKFSPPIDPAGMYNAMIAPLGHLRLAGIAWYQGESDVDHERYGELLRQLLADWRAQFGKSTRFLLVQLPNFGPPLEGPAPSTWAALRNEQFKVAASDGNAVLVPTLDIGDSDSLHPRDKLDVGLRLALAAEGKSLPLPLSAKRAGGAVLVSFAGVEGGLHSTSGGAATGAELCAQDQSSCRYASATVADAALRIVADGRPATRVRYAWAGSPRADLTDGRGLPVPTFELPITP